jgi:hypothetical protein
MHSVLQIDFDLPDKARLGRQGYIMLKARFTHKPEALRSHVEALNTGARRYGNQEIVVLIDAWTSSDSSPAIAVGSPWDIMQLIGYLGDIGEDSLRSVSEV